MTQPVICQFPFHDLIRVHHLAVTLSTCQRTFSRELFVRMFSVHRRTSDFRQANDGGFDLKADGGSVTLICPQLPPQLNCPPSAFTSARSSEKHSSVSKVSGRHMATLFRTSRGFD